MKILTKKSNVAAMKKYSKALTEGEKLLTGGLVEGADVPGNDYLLACCYYLVWSKDRAVYGLRVGRSETFSNGQVEANPYEQDDNDEAKADKDAYLWALDSLTWKDDIEIIGLVEDEDGDNQNKITSALIDAYLESGGLDITDVRC